MNRRALFSRLATIVAAVALAPAGFSNDLMQMRPVSLTTPRFENRGIAAAGRVTAVTASEDWGSGVGWSYLAAPGAYKRSPGYVLATAEDVQAERCLHESGG